MECDCLEHITSRDWFVASGDSYVVKVKEVESAGYAASYLAKYFAKDFLHAAERQALGFSRAWSRSRTWPVDKLQLLATSRDEWRKVTFQPGTSFEFGADRYWRTRWFLESSLASPLMERTGTDLEFELGARKEMRALSSKVKRARELLKC